MKKIRLRKTIKGGRIKPAGASARTNPPVDQGAGDILTKLSGYFKGHNTSVEKPPARVSA